jgi:predicted hotdog family 3-hydroxylacyl-ACP dehydratase
MSHRSIDNPLRHNDMLPAHAGIEYCAQAIAIHGGLTTSNAGPPRKGFLAVLMNTAWHRSRLDDCASELIVTAKKLVVLQQGVSYEFSIKHEGQVLLTGQTVVALE